MNEQVELSVTDLGLASYLMAQGFTILAMRDSARGSKKAFVFAPEARAHVAAYYTDAPAPARVIVENVRRLKNQVFQGSNFENRGPNGAPLATT